MTSETRFEIVPVGTHIGPYGILTPAYRASPRGTKKEFWYVAVEFQGQLRTVKAADIITEMLGGRPIATTRRQHPKLYRTWLNMRRHCYHPWARDFRWYGGRRIRVWPGWTRDFDAFARWATENGFRPGLTIDRRHNDSDYAPWNCRFVDRREQARNRRRPARHVAQRETA
jgi:hypothetical protein